MVSNLTMAGLVLEGILIVGIVIAVFVYFYKKEHFSWKSVGVGALVFIVFSQVLEKLMHLYVLQTNPVTMEWLKTPLLTVLYGGLAAGLFEEVGRWVGFKLLLKKNREWKDGIGFGLGHGGIEALLIGVVTVVTYLMYAVLINNGTFDSTVGSKIPADSAQHLKDLLTNAPFIGFLAGSVERAAALFVHIALSLLVLHGIRTAQKRFLAYAILLHACVDFVPAMYQVHVLPLWATEAMIVLLGAGALWVVIRSKRWFGKPSTVENTTSTGL